MRNHIHRPASEFLAPLRDFDLFYKNRLLGMHPDFEPSSVDDPDVMCYENNTENPEQGFQDYSWKIWREKMLLILSFRNWNKVVESPKVANNGSPGGGSGTGSPLVEIGEIDTRAPFKNVKAAVSMFGEVAVKRKPVVKQSHNSSASLEDVLDKETQLVFAQNELTKLMAQLKSIETAKARGVSDLDRAKRRLLDLTKKLESVSESKLLAIELKEDVKNQVLQLEGSKLTPSSPRSCDRDARKQDLYEAKEKYRATFAELDAAKQQLTEIRQDFDASLEGKMASFEQAADAQYAANVNTQRITDLSKEIAAIRESHAQVRHASEQVLQEHAKTLLEKKTRQQNHASVMAETEERTLALKNEFDDPEAEAIDLKEKLAETSEEIEALQEEIKIVHACDMESVRLTTLELNGATKALQQVAEEENLLRYLVDSLRAELEGLKSENTRLMNEEKERRTHFDELDVRRKERKSVLEEALAEESKVREAYDQETSKRQQIEVEVDTAEKEAQEMKKNSETLNQEAESASIALKEAERSLQVAVEEAKDADLAEKNAIDEIKILSERSEDTSTGMDSGPSASQIKLGVEEFGTLSRKAEELENWVEMKLAAAKAQLEAINASKNEADKMVNANLEDIEDMKAATQTALKQAEMADGVKLAVENELMRLRQQEKNKGVLELDMYTQYPGYSASSLI